LLAISIDIPDSPDPDPYKPGLRDRQRHDSWSIAMPR